MVLFVFSNELLGIKFAQFRCLLLLSLVEDLFLALYFVRLEKLLIEVLPDSVALPKRQMLLLCQLVQLAWRQYDIIVVMVAGL